jgi:tRNA threonylcarbamoyladenosine biosynthesis protein TsaB
MSYQLLIETSTNLGLVSLAQNDQVLQTYFSTEPKSHTEKTHDHVQKILQNYNLTLDKLDFLSCGVGPGSFTGIRVSVNSIKTWNFLLAKPIVQLNTLEVLAMNYFMNFDEEFVFVATNAFKNMVYHGLYRRGQDLRPVKIASEKSIFVKELKIPDESEVRSCGLVGDGYEVYNKYIPQQIFQIGKRPPRTTVENTFLKFDYPCAKAAARLGWLKFQSQETKDWKSTFPLYIRASEAEENLKGMKYIPL